MAAFITRGVVNSPLFEVVEFTRYRLAQVVAIHDSRGPGEIWNFEVSRRG